MDKIAKSLFIDDGPNKDNDDVADRFSSRYTVRLLLVFATLVGLTQYVRTPITCWMPKHFEKSHIAFTNSYCWVKNTYYLPWDEEIPRATNEKRQTVTYYQWIPLILIGQAIGFYLPAMFWQALNSKAGVDADNILLTAHALSKSKTVEKREMSLRVLTKQLDFFLSTRKSDNLEDTRRCRCSIKDCLSKFCCCLCGRRLNTYLLVIFMLSKLLYIANVFGQLFLLGAVLNMRYYTYGIDTLKEGGVPADHDWDTAGYVAFPRVTLCDFNVRGQDAGNVHPHTVQCVLPCNLYNERIYRFLWWWMIFVAAASCVSFVVWFLRAVVSRDRLRFVHNHLKLGDRLQATDSASVKHFTFEYLRQDGALLMRLIAHNTDNTTTTEVVCNLFDSWQEKLSQEDDSSVPVADEKHPPELSLANDFDSADTLKAK